MGSSWSKADVYLHLSMYLFVYLSVCIYLSICSFCLSNYVSLFVHESQRPKNIGLAIGPGGLFDKACNRIGGLAANPPCHKPIEDFEDCSALHRGRRQGFVTERPRQRFTTEEGGPRQSSLSGHNHLSIHPAIYLSIYRSISLSIHMAIWFLNG